MSAYFGFYNFKTNSLDIHEDERGNEFATIYTASPHDNRFKLASHVKEVKIEVKVIEVKK